ncbi:MAG TPA: hypothetical protein VFS91_08155, partial [Nitrobacter sp.]|nr:hypothetical protein [Nitrobacter sp.]
MKAAARFRGTVRVRLMLAWARARRLLRNKNVRAIGAAVATLVLLTSLRAYDPRIVTELKERTF